MTNARSAMNYSLIYQAIGAMFISKVSASECGVASCLLLPPAKITAGEFYGSQYFVPLVKGALVKNHSLFTNGATKKYFSL